jgi:type III secretion protein V
MKLVLQLNAFAEKASKHAEYVAASVVIGIVFMLVLPMPTWLLDILIAINLCASGLIVVVSMYMSGPTAFSTFPAVLLLTTLFRLAISVSTTRLILLEGDAGHIVETFGNFVVGGNIVVGLVVFLILTVVQFLVITKGSERVSEVTARFTLDAMPGKQMSIDSDLRANLITADEAKKKRSELNRESQLHGAMDGAMKFVKGDAIAGIFIVAVNLIGGITIGAMQRGMTAAEAVQQYSVLSIGDALIAQIPALLISLAAGMITTRVSDDEDEEEKAKPGAKAVKKAAKNIGQSMINQLFKEPKALITAGAIMLVFGLIPGMPWPAFLALAVGLGSAGGIGIWAPKIMLKNMKDKADADAAIPKFEDASNFRSTRPMQLVLPKILEGTKKAETISIAVRTMRNRIMQGKGIPDLPLIDIIFDAELPDNTVQFRMVEVPLITSEIRLEWASTSESLEKIEDLQLEYFVENLEGSRRRRLWIKVGDEEILKEAGLAWEPWVEVFASDIETELLRNCQMFLGIQEATRFQRWADAFLPELGKELAKSVNLTRLAEVLQRLSREGVSLRNVRLILESLHTWSQKERDPDLILDHVRFALRRQLCHHMSRDGLIQVVLLSPEVEETLRSAIRSSTLGEYLELDQQYEQQLLDNLADLTGSYGTAKNTPVIVTTADIRRQMRKLIEDEFFSMPVFSFTELSQHYKVQPIGMLEVQT